VSRQCERKGCIFDRFIALVENNKQQRLAVFLKQEVFIFNDMFAFNLLHLGHQFIGCSNFVGIIRAEKSSVGQACVTVVDPALRLCD
jgi:hypothetical protein